MKKILSFTVLLASCLFVLFGCAKDELDTTGSIAGVVTDAETAKALSGATVTLSPSGKSFTTGVDGRYEFRDIAIGNYTVQASKVGYAQNQKSVEVMAGETSSLDIPLSAASPKLEMSQLTLEFGNMSTTLTLDIRNSGSASLSWQVSEDINWLTCLPASGSTRSGETSSVVVNVDRTGLEKGTYKQTLAIISNGGSAVVQVSLSVSSIAISYIPSSFDFGAITTVIPLVLTNNGNGSLQYSLYPSNEWIKMEKNSGVLTTSEKVMISVDRTKNAEGDYKGYVRLIVADESLDIPVSMTIPSKERPTVRMSSVDQVTHNSATFSGALVAVGSANVTRHGFCWSTTEDPVADVARTASLGDASTAKDFTYMATMLEASTTYFVRAFAENAEGISYSRQMKFTTKDQPQPPSVKTGKMVNIQSEQAEVEGEIVGLGTTEGVLEHGHVWSTREAPTIDDAKTALGVMKTTGAYTSTLTNLHPNTTYHVRAYATNQVGTEYGEETTFTTLRDNSELWDGSVATSFAGGTGTLVDPYIIATPAQLAYIETSGKKSAYFKLRNDLDLNHLAWKPIVDFSGHLDGNGKTIYHLRINRNQDNVGLIGNLKREGEVKNLTLSGVYMDLAGNENVGSLVGTCLGNVSNCLIILDEDSKIVGNKAVGGMIGCFGIEMYNSDLKRQVVNCSVEARTQELLITGVQYVGGLIGGTDVHSSATITISGCKVNASVGGNGGIGGIVGYVYNYLGKTIIEESSYEGSLMGEQGVGGITGYAAYSSGGSGSYVIKSCYARPSITCQNNGGGLLGGTRFGRYEITASYAIANFQNAGDTMGGLVGWQEAMEHNETSINCCYSVVQGASGVDGFIGKNEIGSWVNLNDSFTSSSVTKSSSYLNMDNCQGNCVGTQLMDNLWDSGSSLLGSWNFSKTFEAEAITANGVQRVICPRLSWEE